MTGLRPEEFLRLLLFLDEKEFFIKTIEKIGWFCYPIGKEK